MACIKDVYCTKCGAVRADVYVDGCGWTRGPLECPRCGTTEHVACCNGGLGAYRWKYLSGWGEAEGHCRYEGIRVSTEDTARDADGNLVGLGTHSDYTNEDGSKPQDDPKYSAEAIDDRRQRLKSKQRRERGHAPLFFDGKR